MQPKAPTFGLGAHGPNSSIVGRPGAQYITDSGSRQPLDGTKSYRHGGPNAIGNNRAEMSGVNDDGTRYQTHQSSQNSSSFKNSTGSGHMGPNHRKNSKSSYQIIQNSLSKTKSVKTMGPSSKFQQNNNG